MTAPAAAQSPLRLTDVEAAVDEVIRRLGKVIKVGTPLGLGKPPAFLDALIRRAVADPSLQVEIMTALTLVPPKPASDLEQRLAGPILERVLGGVPGFEYAALVRSGKLPANIEVREFYMSPGSNLSVPLAQQSHTSLNYAKVLEAMNARGMNLIAQEVAPNEDHTVYSLSSNPDLSLDEIPTAQARGIVTVGQVNRQLPYMPGEAELTADHFDVIVDNPEYEHPLFGLPKEEVPLTDHLIGLNVSALVADGSTLQVGIGSLGDAVANALILRHQENATWRRLLEVTGTAENSGPLIEAVGGTRPFEAGLYASTEMLVDGFKPLYEAGLLRRRVFNDLRLQSLELAGRLPERFDADTLALLVEEGVVPGRLGPDDAALLVAEGILALDVRWRDGELVRGDRSVAADLGAPAVREALVADFLSPAVPGKLAHAGFFVGHPSLYQWLRDLPLEERARFHMTRVSFTNRLLGGEDLKTAQRQRARLVNTAMMVTLYGSAVSDGLEDGRVVSGVGGQFEFLHMAHQLPDARAILMVRSTRTRGEVQSNIVYRYGHCTVPRHLRDIVVTEYGVADLRGRSDREVVERLLAVTDSRFQESLMRQAKAARKLPADWTLPDRYRGNTPQRLEEATRAFREAIPPFPFGSDLTDVELALKHALVRVKEDLEQKRPGVSELVRTLKVPAEAAPYLERMGLDAPRTFRERALRRLVVYGLSRIGAL